jgi:hypothetical protein
MNLVAFNLSSYSDSDKNPYNQLSDTIVFYPTNEFHTGGTTVLQASPSAIILLVMTIK